MKILGIDFYNGNVQDVVCELKSGGLLVVPAAPALTTINKDRLYYQSLLDADIVIPDSGYMTLIWRVTRLSNIKRISGLKFLKAFFSDRQVRQTSEIFLVDPRHQEAEANIEYLQNIGFKVSGQSSYIAPMYQKDRVEDQKLLRILEEKKPKYIIINLGGGVQEKLGAYLKNNLSYKPAIICTGAAIAFLTGHQATIPNWADHLYLGWLFRCIQKPTLYLPRYLKAFKLFALLLQYGKKMPLQ